MVGGDVCICVVQEVGTNVRRTTIPRFTLKRFDKLLFSLGDSGVGDFNDRIDLNGISLTEEGIAKSLSSFTKLVSHE